MLLRVFLISLAFFATTGIADNSAEYGAHQVMELIEETYAIGHPGPIMFLMTNNFTYQSCNFVGDRHSFKGFVESQIDRLVEITFDTDFKNAEITPFKNKFGKDILHLTFHTHIKAFFKDGARLSGKVTIKAAKKKYGNHFKMTDFSMKCVDQN